jgi:hypothetical protein
MESGHDDAYYSLRSRTTHEAFHFAEARMPAGPRSAIAFRLHTEQQINYPTSRNTEQQINCPAFADCPLAWGETAFQYGH